MIPQPLSTDARESTLMPMSAAAKLFTAILFFSFLVFLGSVDAIVTGERIVLPEARESTATPPFSAPRDGRAGSAKPAVAKREGPDVEAVIARAGYGTEENSERNLLAEIVPALTTVHTKIIFREGDRLSFIAWTEARDSKMTFFALKEALHKSFSPQVSDLIDEHQVRGKRAPRSVLTFIDPSIHTERLLFVRSRGRLYEFHVPQGNEDAVYALIDALTE